MHRLSYEELVYRALLEDLGPGDRTTGSIFTNEQGTAFLEARQEGVIAGLDVAREVFRQVDGEIIFAPAAEVMDGYRAAPGDLLVRLSGPTAGILSGERVALNFLQRMSGIATKTRAAVDAVQGTGVRITDTRKTVPGLRVLDKYAVRVGGGENHRFNLSDMVLIKDNHIKGAGSITEAVNRVRRQCGFPVKIEVEVTNLQEVREALSSSVDVIMLDNMESTDMTAAVSLIAGRALVEASGGITAGRLLEVAKTGVDYISLGYLTNSSPNLDLALDLALDP